MDAQTRRRSAHFERLLAVHECASLRSSTQQYSGNMKTGTNVNISSRTHDDRKVESTYAVGEHTDWTLDNR
jgi:hypothetical protein